MKLWILLCSDLAMRSGTAERVSPFQYDAEQRILRFTTKRNAHLTLPVTQEIAELLAECDPHSKNSFVRQLWAKDENPQKKHARAENKGADRLRVKFREHCIEHGITRRLIPHDLRRTAAVAMLEQTHDIRDVQALLGHSDLGSTFWYLDHDARPVSRSILEMLKRPAWRKEKSA
jgi:integrase/recombinase XerC